MKIIIEDHLLYKEAVRRLKKQWLLQERYKDESNGRFAKRIGIERSNFLKLVRILESAKDAKHIKQVTGCVFCSSNKDIEFHHIYGRSRDNTTCVCSSCHKKFGKYPFTASTGSTQ